MSRIVVYGAIATIFFVAAAAKAQVVTPNVRGLPNASVPAASTVKIYTIFGADDTTYTDRKGCNVLVRSTAIIVRADSSADVYQQATLNKKTEAGRPAGTPYYWGKKYDLTRESDLINSKCAAMLKSLPNEAAKKLLVARVIVE